MGVMVVQVGGIMFIGDLRMAEARGPVLIEPRVLKISGVNAGGDVQLHFHVLIGQPKEIMLHNMLFSYDADESLIRAYTTAVSDIVVASEIPKGLQVIRGRDN
jgi:hypothetical protein